MGCESDLDAYKGLKYNPMKVFQQPEATHVKLSRLMQEEASLIAPSSRLMRIDIRVDVESEARS